MQALGLWEEDLFYWVLKVFLLQFHRPLLALTNSESDRILVLIRLKGGNDGLNTIVPIYDYDRYANLRPTLKLDESSLYHLSDDFGLPSFMSDLQSMWGVYEKVVHGVGYDHSSLSHFSGSDIWASTDLNESVQTGWWGRHFEELYPDYLVTPPEIPPAIQIGSVGNLIFDGTVNNYAFLLPIQISWSQLLRVELYTI